MLIALKITEIISFGASLGQGTVGHKGNLSSIHKVKIKNFDKNWSMLSCDSPIGIELS